MTLRFLTSGESHGRGYLTVLEGFPSGLEVPLERLRGELARRRRGYGRGARMTLERDVLTPWGGLRGGRTTGAPLGFVLENTEWEQWRPVLDPEDVDPEQAEARGVYRPRPGHGDLTGTGMPGTCWNGPAPGAPPPGPWRAPWPGSCWRAWGSGSEGP